MVLSENEFQQALKEFLVNGGVIQQLPYRGPSAYKGVKFEKTESEPNKVEDFYTPD